LFVLLLLMVSIHAAREGGATELVTIYDNRSISYDPLRQRRRHNTLPPGRSHGLLSFQSAPPEEAAQLFPLTKCATVSPNKFQSAPPEEAAQLFLQRRTDTSVGGRFQSAPPEEAAQLCSIVRPEMNPSSFNPRRQRRRRNSGP